MSKKNLAQLVFIFMFFCVSQSFAGWGSWKSMGGNYLWDPALCNEHFTYTKAWMAGLGADRAVWLRRWNGTSWSPAISLGGYFNSSPSLVCTPDRLDVFIKGYDNNISYNTYRTNTGKWSGWRPIPSGTVASGPAAVYRGGNSITVFARGYSGSLKMTTSAFDKWGPWQDLGGTFIGEPGATAAFLSNLVYTRVVVRAPDSLLWMATLSSHNPEGTVQWTNMHRNTYHSPDIANIAGASTRADWFTFNPRGTLDHYWNAVDGKWESLGGNLASGPAGTWVTPNQLLVVVRSPDSSLAYRVFNR